MLITLMTVLGIWTVVAVVLALIVGRVITFHEHIAQLDPLSEPGLSYLSPGVGPLPIRQT
jgi:hypothetical protein